MKLYFPQNLRSSCFIIFAVKIKHRSLFIAGIISLVLCVSLLIVTISASDLDRIVNILLQFLEILFSSGAALSLSLSLTISKKENYIKNKNIDSTRTLSTMNNQTGNNNSNVISLIVNDPKVLVPLVKDELLPILNENIDSISKKFNQKIEKLSKEQRKPLNKEFLACYLFKGAAISNKDIQDIWVRLLVSETKNTGYVSKQTLDIVKNMFSEDAKLFESAARLSTSKGYFYSDYANTKISLEKFLFLKDQGGIKSSDFLSSNFSVNPFDKNHNPFGKRFANVSHEFKRFFQSIHISIESLTKVGLELKEAL